MTDEAARSKPKVISDAALIYSQIPEFHREFLKAVFSIDQIERGLSDSSKLNEDRLLQHNRVVSRRLGLRLSLAEVNALLFPIRYESCLTVREHLEPENFINNPERVLIKDVVELMRQGHLTGDHLSPSELDHRRSIKDINEKYPAAVVNLLELEEVSYRLNPVSNSIVKVWRQYIDLQTAKLKQGALLSVDSIVKTQPKPKRKQTVKKNPEWEQLVIEMYKANPALSHRRICVRLSTRLGENAETIRRKTTNPKPRNKQK